MYKVFIYNKPIYFLSIEEIEEQKISALTYACENQKDKISILSIHRSTPEDKPLYVVNRSLNKLMKLFFGEHKKIEAAGGIVLNHNKDILFIDRLGYWDLPKGKVEKNEELKTAAVREVEEECGISGPKIQHKLLQTHHTYQAKGKSYFKTTHWYLMKYKGKETLVPQTEEGISDARWVDPKNMKEQTSKTYNSIIDVLDTYTS